MNLNKKKLLAVKTLGIGKGRIIFSNLRLDEIKDAITKQDIRDLYKDGAISIREVKGQKKKQSNKRKRKSGKIKKKVNKRKQRYVKMTRKLRKFIFGIREQKKISKESEAEIRRKIRNKDFKSIAHLKEYLKETGAGI